MLYVIIGILALILIVVILNFTLRGNRYDTAIPARSYVVARGTLEDRVSGNGTFKPQTAVTVTAQVSGEVKSIRVSESDVVSAGDVLLSLRDGDYALAAQKTKAALDSVRNSIRQSIVTLRAQYRSAASALADAQRAYDDNTTLYAAKSISEDAYRRTTDALENAKAGLQTIREQLNLRCGYALDADPPLGSEKDAQIVESTPEVEQALLSLQSAQDSVRKCTITAPIAGTITDVRPSVGDVVAPSAPLVRIESLDKMLAEIQIDEVDIGKLRMDQPAEITSDSLIGQTIRGVVNVIAPTVTSLGSTRASLVEVRIDAGGLPAGAVIRSGASCTARISTSITQNALLIPLASFFTEDNTSYVYLFSPTGRTNASGEEVFTLIKRQIETGVSDVNFVEIKAGVSEGDRIAGGNLGLLREGVMVTAQKD
jgi:RND family efflux transporter MFP subunit